jgi:hypothetical protein
MSFDPSPSEPFDLARWQDDVARQPRLVRNAIRCLSCETVIESKSRHDFVTCPCGRVSVDGGLEYNRILWKGDEGLTYENLAVYETPEEVAARLATRPASVLD